MSGSPAGYRTPESRTRVKRAVILIAVAGILLQSVVPVALVALTLKSALDLRLIEPGRGAWWKGSLWLVETDIGLLDGKPGPSELLRWTREAPGTLERMARFDVTDPWLLPDADRLWIVAPDAVGRLGARGFEFERVAPASSLVSAPFLRRGRPALVAQTPAGLATFSFEDGAWAIGELLDLGALEAETDATDVRLAGDADGDDAWLLIRAGGELLIRRGLTPSAPHGLPNGMERAVEGAAVRGQWEMAIIDGEPLLVTADASCREVEIRAYRKLESRWDRDFSIAVDVPGSVGVYPGGGPGRALVAFSGLPGSLSIWEVDGGEVRAEFHPALSPLESGALHAWQFANYALSLLIPVLAVLLLGPVLFRHRDPVCRFEGAAAAAGEYASLPRRGLAKGIDAAIVLLPAAIAWGAFLGSRLGDAPGVEEGLANLAAFFGATLAWSLLCLGCFSFLEARFGQTPGKRLAGVRVVGRDGGRISLGRALLRNLLTIVDGSLSSLVGIALVALTPRRQRLGDLAAKSLVVRD